MGTTLYHNESNILKIQLCRNCVFLQNTISINLMMSTAKKSSNGKC
jgi:hypothetical protein